MSPRVSQRGGDAVDGEVDTAFHEDVVVAGASTPEHGDLQVMQRVEVGKPVADTPGQPWIVAEERRAAGDGQDVSDGSFVLVDETTNATVAAGMLLER